MLGSLYRAVAWLFINQRSLDRELLAVVVDDNQEELGLFHVRVTPPPLPQSPTLLVIETELRDSSGFGCLLVRRLDGPKVDGARS